MRVVSLDGEEALELATCNDFLGQEWHIDLGDEKRIALVHKDGDQEIHLMRDGHGLCGHCARKGLVVEGTAAPKTVDMPEFRRIVQAPEDSGWNPAKHQDKGKRTRLGSMRAVEWPEGEAAAATEEEILGLPKEVVCPLSGSSC